MIRTPVLAAAVACAASRTATYRRCPSCRPRHPEPGPAHFALGGGAGVAGQLAGGARQHGSHWRSRLRPPLRRAAQSALALSRRGRIGNSTASPEYLRAWQAEPGRILCRKLPREYPESQADHCLRPPRDGRSYPYCLEISPVGALNFLSFGGGKYNNPCFHPGRNKIRNRCLLGLYPTRPPRLPFP